MVGAAAAISEPRLRCEQPQRVGLAGFVLEHLAAWYHTFIWSVILQLSSHVCSSNWGNSNVCFFLRLFSSCVWLSSWNWKWNVQLPDGCLQSFAEVRAERANLICVFVLRFAHGSNCWRLKFFVLWQAFPFSLVQAQGPALSSWREPRAHLNSRAETSSASLSIVLCADR